MGRSFGSAGCASKCWIREDKTKAYMIYSTAYQEGKCSKSLTWHFSPMSATSTLQKHIGHMGGEHWKLYLKQCTSLDIRPDDRATPKAVLEEQKEKFPNQFVFELHTIHLFFNLCTSTDAISPTSMASQWDQTMVCGRDALLCWKFNHQAWSCTLIAYLSWTYIDLLSLTGFFNCWFRVISQSPVIPGPVRHQWLSVLQR